MIMQRRQLGQTGIEISPLGLGVVQFAENQGVLPGMLPGMAASEKTEIIRTAAAGGINWFDTGERTGRVSTERALAEALEAAGLDRQHALVAASWSSLLKTARNLRKTIGSRADALAPYRIDLYQVQSTRSFSSLKAVINAAADLLEAGTIQAVGGSGFTARQMHRARAVLGERGWPLASNQVQYSLLNRAIETNGVLETARELGVTIIARAPLGSGLLTGRYHRDAEIFSRVPAVRRRRLEAQLEITRPVVEALESIAGAHQTEPAQIALSWVVHSQGDLVAALPGASRIDHARECVEALHINLTSQEINILDEISLRFR